jgi:hypothetical protein
LGGLHRHFASRAGAAQIKSLSKEFRFAYQRETRFIWAGFGRSAEDHIDLELAR